jgi:hypothetical protein
MQTLTVCHDDDDTILCDKTLKMNLELKHSNTAHTTTACKFNSKLYSHLKIQSCSGLKNGTPDMFHL